LAEAASALEENAGLLFLLVEEEVVRVVEEDEAEGFP